MCAAVFFWDFNLYKYVRYLALDILRYTVTILSMRHFANTTESRMWINADIPAVFTRKTSYMGGLSSVAQFLCRQYVMTS